MRGSNEFHTHTVQWDVSLNCNVYVATMTKIRPKPHIHKRQTKANNKNLIEKFQNHQMRTDWNHLFPWSTLSDCSKTVKNFAMKSPRLSVRLLLHFSHPVSTHTKNYQGIPRNGQKNTLTRQRMYIHFFLFAKLKMWMESFVNSSAKSFNFKMIIFQVEYCLSHCVCADVLALHYNSQLVGLLRSRLKWHTSLRYSCACEMNAK